MASSGEQVILEYIVRLTFPEHAESRAYLD